MSRYEGNNKAHLRPKDFKDYGDTDEKGWKRRIVDSGFNADWKCTKCGYVCKLDFPPVECPKCKKGEVTNEQD